MLQVELAPLERAKCRLFLKLLEIRLLRWSSSRCRQMSHMCTLSNKARAADVLHSCFGQGDFKVVVEEVLEDGTKRTEFPVWSLLLRKWSDVFANMMSHQQFIEGSNAEVVHQGFLRVRGGCLPALPLLWDPFRQPLDIDRGRSHRRQIPGSAPLQSLYGHCKGEARFGDSL